MTTNPTPSQTVGPFYGYALPFPGGGEVAPVGHPDTITLHGYVRRRRQARTGRACRVLAAGSRGQSRGQARITAW